MALYRRIARDFERDLAETIARRLEISDEEFLIGLANKLRFLEQDNSSLWSAIKDGFQTLKSAFGGAKRAPPKPQKLVLTGYELMLLHNLTGFEKHEKLLIQEDYVIEVPVLRMLLEVANKDK